MQLIDKYIDKAFSGHAVQEWLSQNTDVAIYIATAYLAFVFKGPDVIAKFSRSSSAQPAAGAAAHGSKPASLPLLKKIWVVWNLMLSVFSLYGAMVVAPVLINNLRKYGLHDTLCTFREDEFYSTRVGFALCAFAISKLPEFGDTVFLILGGKRNLPFLQWFHHVTTFLFCWFSYQQGSSIFICAAAMNYTVHTIMYFYFAMAEAGYKNLVKPFAMYITILQIAQMVVGLFVSGYVVKQKLQDIAGGVYDEQRGTCSGTGFSTARTQLLVYICNFYLFSQMFIKGYVMPRKSAAPAAKNGKAA